MRSSADPPALGAAVLSAGFLGAPRALSAPAASWSYAFADLATRSPFDGLAEAERKLRPGEILAGFVGYEAARVLEPQLRLPPAPDGLPAAAFSVFRASFAADGPDAPPSATHRPLLIDPGATKGAYAAMVRDIRARIGRGDMFQVNLSHRQSATFAPAERRLADRLPWGAVLSVRFGAFLDLGTASVISASPELFLQREGDHIVSEPIKGTRPRSDDADLDRALVNELCADPKDRAENIMIADLIRNDLAKVCRDGSIREPVLCGVRSLPHVHHLCSRIEGELRAGTLFADALAAAFPCGSVTGAPKLAAMEAIAELEGEGRGPYCGAVFAITRGRAVASVAIRTATVNEQLCRVDARSGGGVTILSDPEAEFEETLDKAYLFRMLTGHDPDRR